MAEKRRRKIKHHYRVVIEPPSFDEYIVAHTKAEARIIALDRYKKRLKKGDCNFYVDNEDFMFK